MMKKVHPLYRDGPFQLCSLDIYGYQDFSPLGKKGFEMTIEMILQHPLEQRITETRVILHS